MVNAARMYYLLKSNGTIFGQF